MKINKRETERESTGAMLVSEGLLKKDWDNEADERLNSV